MLIFSSAFPRSKHLPGFISGCDLFWMEAVNETRHQPSSRPFSAQRERIGKGVHVWFSTRKEEIMAVKILIKRRFQPERLDEAVKLLIRARYEAMKMEGYIASETWRDLRDPNRIVVASMWQNTEAWNHWYTSGQRREFAVELEKVMLEEEQIEPYELGLLQKP
jgi:heme-degrading monooxygenase HmoA